MVKVPARAMSMVFAEEPSALMALPSPPLNMTNGDPSITMDRYVRANPAVSALAPMRPSNGSMKMNITIARTTPVITEPQAQKELKYFAFSLSPWPRAIAMAVQAPPPKRVPTPWKIEKAGPARDSAATCMGSPL